MDPWRKVTGFKNDNNVVSWKLHGLHKKKKVLILLFVKIMDMVYRNFISLFISNKRLGRLENWFHMPTLF
jgi:F0F1-type ATP synthase delta subunit